ncbi:histidine kinase [Flavisolibacter tropicus]|uniref:histidine kinase n=2 Tax=Flavisolibacter tropicus TaxID=1492898 RepID=A0A172U271_9BACT|nr:histidine kinase [Flavisolibacter tropicus]
MLDTNGYIQYSNPAATTLTGYSADELLNRPLAALYPILNDLTKAEYELSQASKRGTYVTEGWKTKKDESKFWASMTLSPLYDNNQMLVGYSCLLRDTTEQKNAELDVRYSEEKYRLMVESVRDYAIFMLDTEGYIKTWNEGAARIKGYTASEIIGKHFSTFYTAEDLESKKPEMELRVALATGKYEEEGWRVRKDGSLFWANVVITALFNEHNKLIGFSKVTRDLTDRKEKDERLRQSEERFRSLVEQVTDYGIFMLDEKGRIVSWNEGARRINGYTAQEVIGKYFSIFYPEEDILIGKPAHELKVARREGKYEEEGWRIRKDGSLFWANIVITAVYTDENILIGFSKVVRDLTERKESEKALRESYDRFRMLAEELKVTNFELSYANEELEQFTSIVSHDLQEPIRTIKSFLQLIDMKLDAKQHEGLKTYISKSINAATRMRELIQNLLHYSQLSKGEIAKENIEVNALIEEALQNVKSAIDASKAQVVIENEVGVVYGDRVQLVQLLQNLITNALKFTEAEQPQIKVTCKYEKGSVRFAVTDNGIGISKSDIPKVFDIFRRLHTKKDYPGTGIGLAICKKIVERHGGHIWPESEPGKGTTFYFTINKENREAQSIA